jgi:hypothetical protein
VTAQAPALQTWPLAQAWPHAPQFRLSEFTSVQVPLQTWEVPVQSDDVELEQPAAKTMTTAATNDATLTMVRLLCRFSVCLASERARVN